MCIEKSIKISSRKSIYKNFVFYAYNFPFSFEGLLRFERWFLPVEIYVEMGNH